MVLYVDLEDVKGWIRCHAGATVHVDSHQVGCRYANAGARLSGSKDFFDSGTQVVLKRLPASCLVLICWRTEVGDDPSTSQVKG